MKEVKLNAPINAFGVDFKNIYEVIAYTPLMGNRKMVSMSVRTPNVTLASTQKIMPARIASTGISSSPLHKVNWTRS